MKFIVALLLVLPTLICTTNGSAQSKDGRYKEIDKKHIIKINILSPFIGTLSLQSEKIMSSESSIQMGIYYFSGVVFGNQYPVNAICFTPEYRFYLTGNAPHGFYIQPFIRIARFWEDNNYRNKLGSNFNTVVAGIVFGKQWIFFDKFTMDIYGGPIFTRPFFDNQKISIKELPPIFNGYWFRSGLTVGYYF